MSDPKGKKPKSEEPEEDFPLEMQPEEGGTPAADDVFPEALSTSASMEEFHFSGPVEDLDFTEPADFTFPSEEQGGSVSESFGEIAASLPAEGEPAFGGEETAYAEPHLAQENVVESEVAGEGIADAEVAQDDKAPKRKFELPAWMLTVQWVVVGVLAVGGLLALVGSSLFIDSNAKQVTLILNIACPVLLALIPIALWRSKARWMVPPASALYTVMLALSAAALISGTWCLGTELSSYEWQYSKARVSKGKPRPVIFATPVALPVTPPEAAPTPVKADGPVPVPAPGKNSAVPVVKASAEPAKK